MMMMGRDENVGSSKAEAGLRLSVFDCCFAADTSVHHQNVLLLLYILHVDYDKYDWHVRIHRMIRRDVG